MLKNRLKKFVPYWSVRLLRKLYYFGWRHRCSVCGSGTRKLLDQGYGYPILERLQVVGGMRKSGDRCPVCHASDRDRLVNMYLMRKVFPAAAPRPLRVLHIAPEKGLSEVLQARNDLHYAAGDLFPDRYFHLKSVERIDLLAIARDAESVDLLICNHVLEHIPDDRAAMREISRVLSPDGLAILQVPISLRLDKTVEGGGGESEAERIARFGQNDHVRIYTADDFISRLNAAGLRVDCYRAFDDDEKLAADLRLNPLEILFACRPAAAPA